MPYRLNMAPVRKNLYRRLEEIGWSVHPRLIKDFGDYRNTVMVSGTGRSGTTWVANIINASNQFRVMFEPFHSLKIKLVSKWNYRQYLRENNSSKEYLGPAKTILSGGVMDPWIDQYNRKVFARKRLVKEIRTNVLLKWIKHHFPEIPIILVLRHPCAVALSKLALGWDTHLDDFLKQEDLLDDHLNPFKAEIHAARDSFEKHVFMWCIENYVPLRQFEADEIHVIFYEEMCARPEKEIARLNSFLKYKSPIESDTKLLRAASPTSRRDSAINTGESKIFGWQDKIDPRQRKRALEILTLFGLQTIYNSEAMPLVQASRATETF